MLTKYYDFQTILSTASNQGLQGIEASQLLTMHHAVLEYNSPVVMELGTAQGKSTTVLLDACNKANGRLVSIDLKDCSDITDNPRWFFVRSCSTDKETILSKTPFLEDGIDVLYVDSTHSAEHVRNEMAAWYPLMKRDAYIFLDDVDSNPYKKGNRKSNPKAYRNYTEIHKYIKELFYKNEDSLQLSIHYGSTGLACIKKLSEKGTVLMQPKQQLLSWFRHPKVLKALTP